MALEGTLRDFSLADILQLISLQKKTGLLTLRSPDDHVTLGFSEGRLVSAESSAKRMDTRLGTVLVKTRRLSAEALSRALEIQSQTLQRLGFILMKNGFCSGEDLREGLDIQIRKITYGLFRWTDGDYVFDQQDRIDYDHEFVAPISVESLLMEGARMMDEWPIIEKVVRSLESVYQRVPVAQPVEPVDAEEAEDFGDATILKRARAQESKSEPIRISKAEWAVYELVDGRRSVTSIIERTFLSDFDGCKAFYDLVSRGLIEEIKPPSGPVEIAATGSFEIPLRGRTGSPAMALLVGAGIVVLMFLAAVLQPRNPVNVLTFPERRIAVLDGFDKAQSLLRLRRLSDAVDTYYLTSGKFPESIDLVVAANLIASQDLLDPWGRRYRYILQPDKYYLVGYDPEGKTDIDVFISRSSRIAATSQAPESVKRSGREVIIIK